MKVIGKKVNLTLENRYVIFPINNVNVIEKLILPTQSLSYQTTANCRQMGLEIEPYFNVMPKILIGQDNCHLLKILESYSFENQSFILSRAEIGWCVHGPLTTIQKQNSFSIKTINSCSDYYNIGLESTEKSLDLMMKRYFEIDSSGVDEKRSLTFDEKRAIRILEKKK